MTYNQNWKKHNFKLRRGNLNNKHYGGDTALIAEKMQMNLL